MAEATKRAFAFPEFHSYPPYYTIQPVQETKEKQLALWTELVLQYCQQTKTFAIDVDSQDDELFCNPRINRKLSVDGRQLVCQRLVDTGRAEWADKSHRKCLVLWFTLQQWAEKIWRLVQSYGLKVTTLDELAHGDEFLTTELEGVDEDVLKRAIQVLVKEGRAECVAFACAVLKLTTDVAVPIAMRSRCKLL